jgi:hypothetical protein
MNRTPFFKELSPLLFGRARANLARELKNKINLEDLHGAFGGLIDERLLEPTSQKAGSRRRKLPLDVTFWAFVSQVMSPGSSCRDAVRRIEAWWGWHQWRTKRSVSDEAYCKARSRLSLSLLESVLRHLAARIELNELGSESLIPGRMIKVVDGSSVSMPDTPELQRLWPQPSVQSEGCGFPVMKIVGVFSLASGALLERAQGNLHQHESTLLRELWHTFKSGDILLEDRGFCSYGTMALLLARGVDTIARLHQARNKDLRQGKALGAKDRLVTWSKPLQRPPGMSPEDYKQLPETLEVRLVGIKVDVPGWRTRSVVVATTLTDPEKYPADLIRQIYLRRWQVEIHFAQIKTLLQLEVLRTRSPEMIEKELLIGLIAYNLVRALMQRSAHHYHVPIERLSFKGSLDTVRHYSCVIRAALHQSEKREALITAMLSTIASDPVPLRPQRSEPRVKKRRPKNYQLMTKPRHQIKPTPHRGRKTSKTS